MAGLAAAYYARQQQSNLAISLLEFSDRLGGKVATLQDGDYLLEGGPDAVVRYKPWALALMRELGLQEEVCGTLPAKPSALIHDGRQANPIPEGLQMVVPGNLMAMAKTPLLSPFGKFRALLDWFIPPASNLDEPFGRFIQRRLGHQVWERLVAPLSGGIYGGDPAELSSAAAFPQLIELEQKHRSLIRGAMAQRKERGSRESGQLFASLSGGLRRWVEALVERLHGVDIHLSTAVQRLEHHADGWFIHHSSGVLQAEAVVLATPAFVSANLLRELHPRASAALAAIPYGDSATVSLAFDASSLPTRVGHGILLAANQGFSARGFTWTDQKWAGRSPQGSALVRAYFSGVGGEENELVALAIQDLKRLWPQVPSPLHTWVFRWPQGLPRYTVGHLQRVQQALQAESLPGLFLAGAAYHGVGLPEVVRMGKERGTQAAAYVASLNTQQSPLVSEH